MKYAIVKFFDEKMESYLPSLIEIENCKLDYGNLNETQFSSIKCKTKRVLFDTNIKDTGLSNITKIFISNVEDEQEFVFNANNDEEAFNLFYNELISILKKKNIFINKTLEYENNYEEIKLFISNFKNNKKINKKDFKNIKFKKDILKRINK